MYTTKTTEKCIIPALDSNLTDRPSVMTGDGRNSIFPIRDCCISGTHSIRLPRAQIRKLVNNVIHEGETFHTSHARTLWAEIAGLLELGIPFKVTKVTTTCKSRDGHHEHIHYSYHLEMTNIARPPMDDFFVPGHEPISTAEAFTRAKQGEKVGMIVNDRHKEFYFTKAYAREVFQLSKLMIQNGYRHEHVGAETCPNPAGRIEECLSRVKGFKEIAEQLHEQRKLTVLLSEIGAA